MYAKLKFGPKLYIFKIDGLKPKKNENENHGLRIIRVHKLQFSKN